MSVLIESIVMLVLLLGVVAFMMTKLVNITKNLIMLYGILGIMWIAFGLLGISIIDNASSWQWPIIVSIPQFLQFATRLPLGKLSQKLRSRKIPILLALFLMTAFAIPLTVSVSFTTLLLAGIGLGIFGATFGMQNQYWSENWNIKNVFITSGLIITLMYIGKFTGLTVGYAFDINKDTVKWVLIAFIAVSAIATLMYVFLIKEDKDTIMLDNKGSYAKHVSEMKLRHIMIFSTMITFTSIAVNLINRNSLVGVSDSMMLKATGYLVTTVFALITAFFLIRVLDDRYINIAAQLVMILGITIMIISVFSVHSTALSFIGLMFTIAGLSTYTMSMFGMMLHIDHKNSLLVLGIWLTIKSVSIATGQLIGGEVAAYEPLNVKYLLIAALALVVVSIAFGELVYKKYTKPGFDLIEELEYSVNHKQNYSEWK